MVGGRILARTGLFAPKARHQKAHDISLMSRRILPWGTRTCLRCGGADSGCPREVAQLLATPTVSVGPALEEKNPYWILPPRHRTYGAT